MVTTGKPKSGRPPRRAMRAFVTGATGVLGRRLVPLLVERGHDVVALVRSDGSADAARMLGATPVRASLFDAHELAEAMGGAELVIHAATSIPTAARTKAKDWRENDRIRVDGTRCLAQAATRVGARRFILQSVVWAARPADGAAFDEDAALVADPLAASAAEAERIVGESGLDATILRGGQFYAPDAAHTRAFGELISKRKLPLIGDGGAVWALVHPDDMARAFAVAAGRSLPGIYHVVDDEPVRVDDFLQALAARLGVPPPARMSPWLARLLVGKGPAEFFTRSTVTTNKRLRGATDWRPRHRTHREGLDDIVAAWRKEGVPWATSA